MNKEVNFETKQLLFDKGWKYELGFDETGHKVKNSLAEQRWNEEDLTYVDITITEVVMWLYEKHGIWVYTKPVLDEDGEWIFKGYVKHLNDFKAKEYQTKLFREPTGAYEAAITYTLENLIQGGNNEQ